VDTKDEKTLTKTKLPEAVLRTPQPARCARPMAKAQRLTHLIFERPDLDKAVSFLTDFGLRVAQAGENTVYLRGTGTAPYCYRIHRAAEPRFVGFGLELGSREELERLAALPGATPIAKAEGPGGGELTVLHDPSGFRIEAMYGQAKVEALPARAPLPMNTPFSHPRINDTQRVPPVPPDVIGLGHIVIEVVEYQKSSAWYTEHFGLIPSDVQVLPDGSPLVTFFRLDLGDKPADHHTLAMALGLWPAYSHSAYEVADADAIGMGQRVLRERGWRHAWGIGRHILGSQIFDYWQDPWGDKHEHYCDGDLFTADRPTGVYAASRHAMSQWGMLMPSSFTRPHFTPQRIMEAIGNVRRSGDLSFAKLKMIQKLFG